MTFYKTNQRVSAEFWASSNPTKKISGTLEIFENGEVEISTIEPFEDKLLKIKREPIKSYKPNQDDINKKEIETECFYYRKNNFFELISEKKDNKKIVKIKTKFNNDDEISEFDWVEGVCEFGCFKFFCNGRNLTQQKGFKYSTYSGFSFGILYKDMITKKQDGFDKVRFRIDYLSIFFADKSKLSQLIVFPDSKDKSKTIYQINYHNKNEEILSFWLDKYKITFASKVTNFPTGNKRFEKNQQKIDVTEDYWIDVSKNKGVVTENEVLQLQAFFERYFSFCLNTPVYTQSVVGFIDKKLIDVIFRKTSGETGKIEYHKIIFTHNNFTARSMYKFWINRVRFATLYGYTLSNMQSQKISRENFLFNFIQAIENYLNTNIKQSLFDKYIASGKYASITPCLTCKKPKPPKKPSANNPSFTAKFTEMVERSNFLLNHFKFDLVNIPHIKKIRNALAHGDAQEQNELIRDTNIYLLSTYLRKTTKYCILKTLGFDENQILKFLGTYDK